MLRTETAVQSLLEINKVTARDGHFRISNLSNLNPGNFEPESGSIIGLLSPKIFFVINALLRYH